MKLEIVPNSYGVLGSISLVKEPGEPRVKNESDLFFRLKKTLQDLGEDVIKKLMWKDGHMVSDQDYYVRSRDVDRVGAYAIYDPSSSIKSAAQEYNEEGRVRLFVRSFGNGEPRLRYLGLPKGVLDWWPSS